MMHFYGKLSIISIIDSSFYLNMQIFRIPISFGIILYSLSIEYFKLIYTNIYDVMKWKTQSESPSSNLFYAALKTKPFTRQEADNLSFLMVHLSIGYKVLDLCPDIEDPGAFLLGSIAPDAIMFKPGCVRSDKTITHFCTGDEDWGFETNYDGWLENLSGNIKILAKSVNKDFLFGYTAHIITDIENTRHFWTPVRLTNNPDTKNTFFNDCYEIDSILYEKIMRSENLWNTLENANKYEIGDLVMIEDLSTLINKMQLDMYFNRNPDLEYKSTIFTMEKATSHMDMIIDTILDHRKLIYPPE